MSVREGAAADLDRALDGLLAGEAQPAAIETADLLSTARLLYDVLPRYHPRFAFEEHLARRLAAAGRAASASPLAEVQGSDRAGDRARLVLLPTALAVDATARTRPAGDRSDPGAAPVAAARRRRGLLAGGAIASGVSLAIPLAGAAFVAWRRGRAASGGA